MSEHFQTGRYARGTNTGTDVYISGCINKLFEVVLDQNPEIVRAD